LEPRTLGSKKAQFIPHPVAMGTEESMGKGMHKNEAWAARAQFLNPGLHVLARQSPQLRSQHFHLPTTLHHTVLSPRERLPPMWLGIQYPYYLLQAASMPTGLGEAQRHCAGSLLSLGGSWSVLAPASLSHPCPGIFCYTRPIVAPSPCRLCGSHIAP
jgi:hypothetical protein